MPTPAKSHPETSASVDPDDIRPARTIIDDMDVALIGVLGNSKMTTSQVANAMNIRQSNAHKKLSRMIAKGFLSDSHHHDDDRIGLHKNEDRRYWSVAPLGHEAVSLHTRVQISLKKHGGQSSSPRTTGNK